MSETRDRWEIAAPTAPSTLCRESSPGLRVALVGTYPPTRCGIATYTASLREALSPHAAAVEVVRLVTPGDDPADSPEVVATLDPDDAEAVSATARLLDDYDVVVLQHEFGIYGANSGAAAVALAEAVSTPLVVTLHTVTSSPSVTERRQVARLASRARRLIVLSRGAVGRLATRYGVPPERVEVIPHGSRIGRCPDTHGTGGHLLLTWGLIGPGKGIETGLAALPKVVERFPEVRWIVAGQTHPKVRLRQGEAYRRSLEKLAGDLGVADHFTMIDRYLSTAELDQLLRQATAVVLPYDSTEQTSSGVLVEAVAAGVPVVATAFPHAVELASAGAAITVPQRHPDALAAAIISLLSDPESTATMVAAQRSLAQTTEWEEVGRRYLVALLDSCGMEVA